MSQATHDQPNASIPARLSVTTKLAYGAGDLGAAIVAAITGFFLNAFLLDVAGLRPGVVGIIFLVSTLWDAVTDPVVGNLSDRTRSRWGRRRPWLLFGAIPFGLAYFLHWLVPDMDANGLFIYYLVVALLLKTAFTVVNIPYTALTPELTPDYDERTRLTAYRFSFSILGGVAAVALHPILVGFGGDDVVAGHTISAGVWAVFIVLSAWVAFAGTRETHREETTEAPTGFMQGIRIAFNTRPFLYVTGIYLLSWLTIQIIQVNLLLYVRYWIDAEDSFTILVLILQVTAFLFLSVWSWFSARYGKKRTYYAGAVIWMAALTAVFFIPQNTLTPMYFIVFFAGMGVSVAYLIPWSMLPDVIEYDELETGTRHEGVFYGFFVFLQKLGISLGLAVSNFLLEAAGYVNPETVGEAVTQPDSVLTVLRLFVSFLPVALLLLSLPLAYFYPITPTIFKDIQAKLAQKKGA
jgi:GPH family glycoside/pentoside/hexuronide:cation symporter